MPDLPRRFADRTTAAAIKVFAGVMTYPRTILTAAQSKHRQVLYFAVSAVLTPRSFSSCGMG